MEKKIWKRKEEKKNDMIPRLGNPRQNETTTAKINPFNGTPVVSFIWWKKWEKGKAPSLENANTVLPDVVIIEIPQKNIATIPIKIMMVPWEG